MTLTESLLARIAEDEASLPEGHDCWYPPERYAAECEAKRRIVELHHEYRGICSHCVDPSNPPYQREAWPCVTIRALAAIWPDMEPRDTPEDG
jgi:hypothetical protein